MDKSINITGEITSTENDRWRINATWLGEGYDGDYQADDINDEPLMRFDVIDKTAEQFTDEYMPYSYCTNAKANDIESCQRFIEAVLLIVKDNSIPKHELERLTWWDGNNP